MGVGPHDHVGVHLHEPPVAVPGEALVAAHLDEPVHGLVVEAQVEDGIHHAGHGGAGAGAHGDEEGFVEVAEGPAEGVLEPADGHGDLDPELGPGLRLPGPVLRHGHPGDGVGALGGVAQAAGLTGGWNTVPPPEKANPEDEPAATLS